MIYAIYRHTIIITGTILNMVTMSMILSKTPKTLKEYSYLLLYDCITELVSISAHFIVKGRIFVSSNATIIIADGSCCAISDNFCSTVTAILNINMIHSISIIALSFWYRTRILQEKGPVGKWRLLSICILIYIPHIMNIYGFVHSISPRNELEIAIDPFYYQGYSKAFGLYGYVNRITDPIPLLIGGYLVASPVFLFSYIYITRIRLLSMLLKKANIMSEKTRSTHESLAKALTIHAFLPIYVSTSLTVLIIVQILFDKHSELIEGLEYDVSVLPTLVNPCLTLYFVRPYRTFLQRLVTSGQRVETASNNPKHTSSHVV